MRYLIFIIIICIWLTINSFSALAAPCYGTKMPEKGDFFGGFETYAIIERHQEESQGELRSRQYFFQISYGVFDWLSLDLKGGTGNLKQHPTESDEIDYPSSFAGGYGLRFKFIDNNKFKMVFGFQHISVHPRTVIVSGVKNQAVLDDWQTSLLASYDFSKITPYLGAKFQRVDYIHWVDGNRKRKMSDLTKTVGIVLGIDFSVTKNAWLNLEGQILDGQALATSFNFKF